MLMQAQMIQIYVCFNGITSASTRKNRPDHGSCLRNTRARLVFPVTTVVIANEELRIEELNTTGQKYRTKKIPNKSVMVEPGDDGERLLLDTRLFSL